MAGPEMPGRRMVSPYVYVVGAGVLALGFIAWRRSRANKAAAAAAAAGGSTTGLQAVGAPAAPTSADLANLQAQIADLSTSYASATDTSGVYTPPTGETRTGSGYGASPTTLITNPQGTNYQNVGGLGSKTVSSLTKTGATLYWQPTPGIFTKWIPGKTGLTKGTPLFIKAA